MKRVSDIAFRFFLLFIVVIGLQSCGVSKSIKAAPKYEVVLPERRQLSDTHFVLDNNSLQKNKLGLWELYVEGNALERGLAIGSLTQELMQTQEHIFFSKVEEMVPSKGYQKLLRKFLAWFNRKLYLHINEEYKTEIYGVSKFAAAKYDYIASPYLRSLYLHGAHDIGHALQDLALVGCSSFAAWGDKTVDGGLIIGRNFDFYAGDEFAKQKIVSFVNPDMGYKFMSIAWGGMIGVVSGMNDQGITVTINAGKSKIPLIAKTPISLVTREILQYASTIDEAIAIAKKREVFVSESIFIGSAKDKRAMLIEVSPKNFGVYEVANSNQLVCANHFQSDAYKDDKKNLKHIKESHSQYRYDKMLSLLAKTPKLSVKKAVTMLRAKEGLKDKAIGYGNEKALNQLLAHHGIVFQPEKLKVWVSTNPYQLGEFVAYDLNEVFNKLKNNPETKVLSIPAAHIPADDFINSKAFANYEAYRVLSREIQKGIVKKNIVSEEKLISLQKLNPEYWEAYYIAGKYYYNNKMYDKALLAFEQAIAKEVTTLPDVEQLNTYIKKSKRKRK